MEFDPLLSPIVIALVAAAVLATALRQYISLLQRGALKTLLPIIIRALSVLAICLFLFNPIAVEASTETEIPRVIFLVDNSASMGDRVEDSPRITQLANHLAAPGSPLKRLMSGTYDRRWYTFSDALKDAEEKSVWGTGATGSRTDLASSLAAAIERNIDGTIAAVVVMSDGRANAGPEMEGISEKCRLLGIPVYCIGVGQERRGADLGIISVAVPRRVREGSRVSLQVGLAQHGFDGKEAVCRVMLEGEEVASRRVSLGQFRTLSVNGLRFTVGEPGVLRGSVVLDVPEGDLRADNNRYDFSITIVSSSERILLLHGQHTWATKFLRQSLRRSRRTDLCMVAPSASDTLVVQPPAGESLSPVEALEFDRYALVILGPGFDKVLNGSQQVALHAFVEQGGKLLVWNQALAEAGALADLLPVTGATRVINDPFTIEYASSAEAATVAAGFSRDRLARLNVGGRCREFIALDNLKAGAAPLFEGVDGSGRRFTLAAMQRVGAGACAAFGEVGIWHSVFAREATEDQRQAFDGLWSAMLGFLVRLDTQPPGEVTLSCDRDQYDVGDRVKVRAVFTDDPPESESLTVVSHLPSGRSANLILNKAADAATGFSGDLDASEPGVHTLTLDLDRDGEPLSASTFYFVRPEGVETDNTEPDFGLLQNLSRTTGGDYYHVESSRDVFGSVSRDADIKTRTRISSRWGHGEYLWILIGLMGCEWFIRRKKGVM